MDVQEELKQMIQAGSVKRCKIYGQDKIASVTPYFVIVPQTVVNNYAPYTIRVHMDIGQEKELREYVVNELPELLQSKKNLALQPVYKLSIDGVAPNIEGIGVDQGDNTIVMARTCYRPIIFS